MADSLADTDGARAFLACSALGGGLGTKLSLQDLPVRILRQRVSVDEHVRRNLERRKRLAGELLKLGYIDHASVAEVHGHCHFLAESFVRNTEHSTLVHRWMASDQSSPRSPVGTSTPRSSTTFICPTRGANPAEPGFSL